jgi:hypothetical protein
MTEFVGHHQWPRMATKMPMMWWLSVEMGVVADMLLLMQQQLRLPLFEHLKTVVL